MELPLPDLSVLLCAGAMALPILIPCAAAPAQSQPDADARSIVAKIDAARGAPPPALSIEGTFAVTFEGAGADAPPIKGKFREAFAGTSRARHTSELGEHGSMERGITDDLAWEVDPAMGAKVHSGSNALTVRRYFALLRGARPSELYEKFARTGTKALDGKEHVVLKMTPAEGKPDTWYVDPDKWTVRRVDIALPTPESADSGFGIDDAMDSQITFDDWKSVGGAQIPQRRTMRIGPATVALTCTKVEAPAKLEPAVFMPPEAVTKIKGKPVAKAFDAEGKPSYQVVEREAQPVATIRVKCKPSEISATLSVLLPEVMAHVNAIGVRLTGAPFSRYHAIGDDEVDIEAGLPVAKPITEKGRVKSSELPAGKAVTVWHVGPYEKLGEAHHQLRAHLAANGLKARGGPWEIYWTDPGMVPEPSKWRTQIFAPIE